MGLCVAAFCMGDAGVGPGLCVVGIIVNVWDGGGLCVAGVTVGAGLWEVGGTRRTADRGTAISGHFEVSSSSSLDLNGSESNAPLV